MTGGYESLKGRVAVITGASAGIGQETARIFASNGCNLILGARRLESLESLKSELLTLHPHLKIHVGKLDVTDAASVDSFMSGLPAELSSIDILVNNAGAAIGRSPAYGTPEEDMNAMIDANVKGALRMIRSVVPGMMDRNRGDIVNISSIAGREAYIGGSVYCATKHALNAITTSLRKEVMGTPLRVISVAPGLVETEFSIVRHRGDSAAAAAVYAGLDPLVAADIADNIAYAVSRKPHVQICDITVMPTNQSSTEMIHRSINKA